MRLSLAKTAISTACAIAIALTCAGFTMTPARASAAAGPKALSPPPCATATAPSALLKGVRTAMVTVHGAPFGVATAGRWAFAAANGVEVLREGRSLAPTVVRTIRVPGGPGALAGLAVTPDGRYLLGADNSGAVVISVARAERGAANAVLGTLSTPGRAGQSDSAIEVAISPDGQFAFVTLEYADQASVFNLGRALHHGFGRADYVGSVPLGEAAVGMAVSPDGRWLYATSELALPKGNAVVARDGRLAAVSELAPASAAVGQQGTLTVINLRRAQTHPASSIVATVNAGCEPVRVITSADGRQVWVTARGSDDLLCFAAARLRSDPARALAAVVRVGEAPVGLALARGGALIVVADSNRFGARGAGADLEVVNVAAALAGRRAVLGHIRSGLFPREMALLCERTLLVSNFESGQVEAVDVASIGRA